VYYNFDELFQDYSTELENTKQEIITQKMDTLFNYIKEDVSADKFKKSLKDYSAKNEIFRDLMATNKLLNDNVHKKELIDKKMETIYGIIERMENIYKAYHKEHNPQLLKDIVYIKVKELDPEFLALRQIKYELCEMYTNDTSDDVLFQRENALSSITYSFDEIPHTIQYVK
jgi:phosphoglycerate-specific signal transduction histidine kinase